MSTTKRFTAGPKFKAVEIESSGRFSIIYQGRQLGVVLQTAKGDWVATRNGNYLLNRFGSLRAAGIGLLEDAGIKGAF